jgi:hypothetical protein
VSLAYRLSLPVRLLCRVSGGHAYDDRNSLRRLVALNALAQRGVTRPAAVLAMVDAFPADVSCMVCGHRPREQRMEPHWERIAESFRRAPDL